MDLDKTSVNKIISAIKNNSDYDFGNYSVKSLNRRLTRIVTEYRMDTEELCSKIEKNNDFLEKIVRDITVNTTEFFRDPDLWIYIKNKLIKEIADKSEINIWHAGCSNGQELYSMMVMLNEFDILDKTNFYGSDLNSEILQKAKNGKYKYYLNETFDENLKKVFNNADEIKSKYFEVNANKNYLNVKKSLINQPKFFIHDLVKMADFTDKKFDIIFCRNVLIYFNLDLQNEIFRFFGKLIKKDGFLIIGLHESIFGNELKIFKKLELQVYKKI